MKLSKSIFILSLALCLSACSKDDCYVNPVLDQNLLTIRVKNDASHSIEEDVKFLGFGKVEDTLFADKFVGYYYYDYVTNQSYIDSTYIYYRLYLPLNKKTSNTAFQIFYRDQIDTLSLSYSSSLQEKRIGRCNSNKYEYEIENLNIDKITFDTISPNPDEASYYYYGSILADFQ